MIPLDRIFVEDPVRMLRAIKYSAKTGSKMNFACRRKIRQCANLLSSVSPSRLTEELLKILNSGRATQIVAEALDTDLYMALQPAATAMIYDNRKFEASYMQNMQKLDNLINEKPDARLGEKLVFLIYDFVLSLTDWQKEIENKSAYGELYLRTWQECRNFVLPMNPQRTELEFAVKEILGQIGITGKRKKTRSRQRNSIQPQKIEAEAL